MIQQIISDKFPNHIFSQKNNVKLPWLPLFVLDTVPFPGEELNLHVYEPRYRLMIRRCLEGSRTFGIATFDSISPLSVTQRNQPESTSITNTNSDSITTTISTDSTNSIVPTLFTPDTPTHTETQIGTPEQSQQQTPTAIGTVVSITRHRILPDWRILLTVIGLKRIRIKNIDNLDGYFISNCDFDIDDKEKIRMKDEEEELEKEELDKFTEDKFTENKFTENKFTEKSESTNSTTNETISSTGFSTTKTPRLGCLSEAVKDRWKFHLTPTSETPRDPFGFSMWCSARVPIRESERQKLLELESTKQRLHYLLQLSPYRSWWVPCLLL